MATRGERDVEHRVGDILLAVEQVEIEAARREGRAAVLVRDGKIVWVGISAEKESAQLQ